MRLIYLPDRCIFVTVSESPPPDGLFNQMPGIAKDDRGGWWVRPDQLGAVAIRLLAVGESVSIQGLTSGEPATPHRFPELVPGLRFRIYDLHGSSVAAVLTAPSGNYIGFDWVVETEKGLILPMSEQTVLDHVRRFMKEQEKGETP